MSINVLLSPDDFARDLDQRLGRANGNVYHRQEGIEGVHDGQYMIRLKKKRFVILDYSIVPTDADYQTASVTAHIHIPEGAGKQQCSTAECCKVGIPVCLYDSSPDDTPPLYLRSGLCFTCQRNLNEKRRTVRKRKSDGGGGGSKGAEHVYTVASSKKKFKMGGSTIELASDALIVNGPVDGARQHGPGYGFSEIGEDLATTIQEVADNTNRLLTASGQTTDLDAATEEADSTDAAARRVVNAAVAATEATEDFSSLYETAFKSMSKGLYLLSQWKASWDAAVTAAVVQETGHESEFADAVASAAAAAVAAASVDSQDQNADNMVSLLLAAEKKGDDKEGKEEVVSV